MENDAMLFVTDEILNEAKKSVKYTKERQQAQRHGFELPFPELSPQEMEDEPMPQLPQPQQMAPSMSSSSPVKMRFPDGSVRYAPAGEIDRYAQMGGTLVQ